MRLMRSYRDDTELLASTGLQFWVFSLVTAAFITIYITQPVLPIIQAEFGVDETRSSLTISAVIFGMALSNLPLGIAADRFAIKPIIFTGGCVITFTYFSYLVGIIIAPLCGKLSNRIGNAAIMAMGSVIFGVSLGATLIKSVPVIAASLAAICAGFFSIHSSAAGALNTRLKSSRGRANSLYVLSYYLGGYMCTSLSVGQGLWQWGLPCFLFRSQAGFGNSRLNGTRRGRVNRITV